MSYKYNPYLSTQSEVVYEIVSVLRDFSDGKLSNEELEDTVIAYIKAYQDFIFDVKGDNLLFKGFPKQKLGKKRIRIIAACIEKKHPVNYIDLNKGVISVPDFNGHLS